MEIEKAKVEIKVTTKDEDEFVKVLENILKQLKSVGATDIEIEYE